MDGNITTWVYSLTFEDTTRPLDEVASLLNPDPVSKETVTLLHDILSCHVIPIISAGGIVGNVLNFIVLLMQKKKQPMNTLLVVLAVVDTGYLLFDNRDLVACIIGRSDPIAGRNFTVLNLTYVVWIGVIFSRTSSLLTVVLSVERCLVVMLPLRVKMLVTPLTIRVTTGLACVFPAVAYIPVFLRGEIQWLEHSRLNMTLPYLKLTDFAIQNSQFFGLYVNLVLNILFRYVTMATVTICSGLTIFQLRRYSRWRLTTVTSQSDRATISERDARVSAIMMRVCVLFMVCYLPGCIMLTIRLIQPEFDYYGVYSNSFDIAREINVLFLDINSSANFIIYMQGGDEFRRTFDRICRKVLPVCCFRFLFRCGMRSDPDLDLTDKLGHSTDGYRRKKKGNMENTSDTNISTVYSSSVSVSQAV